MKTKQLALAGVIGLSGFALNCSGSDADCNETRTCAAIPDGDAGGTDGSSGGTDGGVPIPPGCDPTADAKDAPKCVVNEFGVFVDAAKGNDGNSGSKELPMKTIGGALGKLNGKSRVYVCEGTYAESVKVTSAVSIYGGFACADWSYSGAKAKVAATSGYALEVQKVADAFVLSDLGFVAPAGTEAAPSSIAAFVNATPKLTLRRVDLEAQAGAKGKDQQKAAAGSLMSSMPTAATLNGNNGDATNGGLAQLCTCVGGGTSKGGGGGSKDADGSTGATAQAVPDPSNATGAGQTATDCEMGTNGARPGSNAPNAAPADGAKRLGDLSDQGWIAEAGKAGSYGAAGQGGGGGGGSGGGGGGGACGGCGGAGGQGGGGGGASAALLALDSPVSLVGCSLTTADAGGGGAGGPGGDGVPGGTKGARGGAACDGANGGKGGNGGAGGGGAGGVSAGVLYKGGKPTIDAVIKTGNKGAPGAGAAGNDGLDGQKADTLEVQ